MNSSTIETVQTSRALLMQQVNIFLSQCGLLQYYDMFIEEGFDRPESLMEITETDLIQMEVKRGHRRLLQRAISNAKGIPSTVPLNIAPVIKPSSLNNVNNTTTGGDVTGEFNFIQFKIPKKRKSTVSLNDTSDYNTRDSATCILQNSPGHIHTTTATTTTDNNNNNNNTNNHSNNNNNSSPVITHNNTHQHQNNNEYFPSAGTMTHNATSGMSSTEEEAVTSDNVHRLWKRKYHRHAKPDSNAPLKPPSAYVTFSNDVRSELKQQNKSFTDLAKIIGDRWKNISPEEKELYETSAMKSREEYLAKLEEYHKTDEYKKYQQYLSDFKAENEAAARPVGRPRKRHRKDDYTSDGTVSDAVTSSSGGGGGAVTAIVRVIPLNATRKNSSPNSDNASTSTTRQYPFYLLNNEESSQQQQQQQKQK